MALRPVELHLERPALNMSRDLFVFEYACGIYIIYRNRSVTPERNSAFILELARTAAPSLKSGSSTKHSRSPRSAPKCSSRAK